MALPGQLVILAVATGKYTRSCFLHAQQDIDRLLQFRLLAIGPNNPPLLRAQHVLGIGQVDIKQFTGRHLQHPADIS